MNLTTRPAIRNDRPGLLDLYQHLVPGDDRPTMDNAAQVFERFLSCEGSVKFGGEAGGVLIASCTLVVVPNLTRGGRPYGLIENVVAHGHFRKRGFGKQVLAAASSAAWNAGCYKVMLMTGSTRPETRRFYLDAGFEQSKTGFQMRRIAARPETATAVAGRRRNDECLIIAPFGTHDLENLILRPASTAPQKMSAFDARIRAKGWRTRWPQVQVVRPGGSEDTGARHRAKLSRSSRPDRSRAGCYRFLCAVSASSSRAAGRCS